MKIITETIIFIIELTIFNYFMLISLKTPLFANHLTYIELSNDSQG